MKKTLVFDMDGVLAGLYQVDNWLFKLEHSDPSPYEEACPLVDLSLLIPLLYQFKEKNWSIAITSWLAKNSTPFYDQQVRQAKKNWLDKNHFPYDEIHLIKYGTTKANATRHKGGYQVLIDDNEKIRQGWNLGDTINGREDFYNKLKSLLDKVE